MKVEHIKQSINEAVGKKMSLDEESIFDGHNFVTHGKEISMVDIDLPLVRIDKDTVVVKWVGKPELHNDGVYAFHIDIKSMTASSEEDVDSETQATPLNFNGFEFIIKKIKNPEVAEVQIFISNIYVVTQEKKIYVDFTI